MPAPDTSQGPQPEKYLAAVDNIAAHTNGAPTSRQERLAFADKVCDAYESRDSIEKVAALMGSDEAKQFMVPAAVEHICPENWDTMMGAKK